MTATESPNVAELKPNILDQQSSDLPAVLSLLKDSFAPMKGRIDPPSSVSSMTLKTLRDHTKKQEIWTVSSPPKACMFLTINPDHIYLGKLAVAPSFRGQGLASSLIETAKVGAANLKIKKLRLRVRVELLENQQFFVKQGFREINRTAHPGFDRPTSISYEWTSENASQTAQ